jgi:type VI secretion system FHA domain protein
VLPKGKSLRVGDYVVDATELEPTVSGAQVVDAWAELDREHSGSASEPEPEADAAPAHGEDDPFSDWGFNTTFDPNSTHGRAKEEGALDSGDLSPFFRGLGIDTGGMSEGELEAMGRIVRLLVLGMLDLHATVTGVKSELRSEDRTMVAPRDNNPLKTSWPSDTKLRYLFGGRIAAAGYVPAERAMREVLVDLVAHNSASAAAARAAIEGTLRDVAPAAIKAKLLGEGKVKLFEGTRAWDAFSKWHDEQSEQMQQWVQRQLDRHFTEAYLRESLRIRRATKK